jgi:hypothetical protein
MDGWNGVGYEVIFWNFLTCLLWLFVSCSRFLLSLSWVGLGNGCGELVGIIDTFLKGKYLDGNEWVY